MGVFEKVLHQPETPTTTLTPPQAFVAILLGAASVDGSIDPAEMARLNQALASTRLFRSPSGAALQPTFDGVMALIEAHGVEAITAFGAANLPETLRAPTFAIAVDLVLTDGQASLEERKFIDRLQQLLRIGDEAATKIVEVLIVKNSV